MTPADRVVVFLAVLLLPFLYFHFWGGGTEGEIAKIIVNGGAELLVPLNQDKVFTVTGPLGNSQLEVKDGKIRFMDSPCQGKQCISSGWLHASGAFTACLPNRVTLYITGKGDAFDTINF
jgi:hypothetical protein